MTSGIKGLSDESDGISNYIWSGKETIMEEDDQYHIICIPLTLNFLPHLPLRFRVSSQGATKKNKKLLIKFPFHSRVVFSFLLSRNSGNKLRVGVH